MLFSTQHTCHVPHHVHHFCHTLVCDGGEPKPAAAVSQSQQDHTPFHANHDPIVSQRINQLPSSRTPFHSPFLLHPQDFQLSLPPQDTHCTTKSFLCQLPYSPLSLSAKGTTQGCSPPTKQPTSGTYVRVFVYYAAMLHSPLSSHITLLPILVFDYVLTRFMYIARILNH